MSDTTQYDKYIPLFGRDNDLRVRLFLHELKKNADKIVAARTANKNYQDGDLMMSDVPSSFMNEAFHAGGDKNINDEWVLFFLDMLVRLAAKEYSATKPGAAAGPKFLSLVKSLAGSDVASKNGSLDQLVALLLSKFAVVHDGAIKPLPIKDWATADKVVFNSADAMMAVIMATGTAGTVGRNSLVNFAGIFKTTVDTYVTARAQVVPGTVPIDATTGALTKADYDALKALVVNTNSGLTNTSYINLIPNESTMNNGKAWTTYATYVDKVKEVLKWNETAFTINNDKLVLRELEYWVAQKGPAAPKSVSSFFNVDTTVVSASGAEYFQDDKHQLWKGKPNQEGSTPVSFGSNAWKDLKISNKCVSTGVAALTSNGNTCRDYLMSCLSGNKIDKCKQFLSEEAFFDNAEAEVKNMNPELLYSTLRAFQFNFSPSDNKVDSYEQWTATLNANPTSFNLTKTEVDSIVNNGKLKAYLGMIVSKVNSNPDIVLSKRHLKASSAKPQKANPSLFGLQPRKINVNAGRMLLNAISTPYVLAPAPNPMAMLVPLSGGGLSASEFLRVRSEDASKRTASTYANIFADVENRLAKLNKSVDDETKQGFDNLTLSLDKYEQKLIENFNVYQKYLELHEIYGKNDKNSEVTMSAAKEFTERGDNITKKVAKKRMTLERILNALEYAAENQGNVQPASTSNPARQSLP